VKYARIHTELLKLSARAGLPWFKAMGVSKRRTQAGTLVLRLMGRCAGLKRPCTGPYLEGRAKKEISMLFCPVSLLGGSMLFRGADVCSEKPVEILWHGNGKQRETKGNGFCCREDGSKAKVCSK